MASVHLHLALFAIFLLPGSILAAWNPDAGLAVPLSRNAPATYSSMTYTSLNHSFMYNLTDGNALTSFWQSDACFPTNFMGRADLNPILNACANSARCRASGGSRFADATDTNVYTGASITAVGGIAWLTVSLPSPQPLYRVMYRGIFGAPTNVSVVTAAGEVIDLGSLNSTNNYNFYRYIPGPDVIVAALRMSSTVSFTVTEISAMSESCFQHATIDLGRVVNADWFITRHWVGGHATSSQMLRSVDGVAWTKITDLDPTALALLPTLLDAPVPLRYLRIRHQVDDVDWAKVYVWEMEVYDAFGPFGAPEPPTAISPRSMRDLLGVNGIWGWGANKFSDTLVKAGQGPVLYSSVASHARNYHNWRWDVSDPDNVCNYTAMALGKGTQGQWWLNWDREYRAWRAAGLEVAVTLQFDRFSFPTSVFNAGPYQCGYQFGDAFAAHFGPQANGNTLVDVLEVGNEPWDGYSSSWYRELLLGTARASKSANPKLRVLPAAFQANDFYADSNYLGTKVNETMAPLLDGVNTHVYSFLTNASGVRLTTYPEHRASSFQAVKNIVRWRNVNMPDKPVYVTEWGWDSPTDSTGALCTANECVSETAQGLYAVRGALLLARWGAFRATWFFYADDKNCTTLFCRSGLYANNLSSSKASLRALQSLLARVGTRHFVGAVAESPETGYVYLLGTPDGTPTHAIGWRPVPAEDTTTVSTTVTITGQPGKAWQLDGVSSTGTPVTAVPVGVADGQWTIAISTVPLVIEIVSS